VKFLKLKRIVRSIVVFSLVGLMVLSTLLFIPSVPVVKADALSDAVQTIYNYEQSGAQFSFGPQIGSAITAGCLLAVTAGAAFESKGQIETFYAGFCDWTTAHGYNDQQWLAAAQTIGSQIVYTFSPAAVQTMKSYITSIKVDPASVSYVGSVGSYVCPVSSAGEWQSIQIDGINSLGLGSSAIYILSWNQFANNGQVDFKFSSVDNKGFTMSLGRFGTPTAIIAGHSILSVAVSAAGVITCQDLAANTAVINNYLLSSISSPLSSANPLLVTIHAQNSNRTLPISMTLDRDLISNDYGNLTGIDEGVTSQNPSAVLDGTRPVAVTVPLNPTYDDVIGKTATDTVTTVTSDTSVVPVPTVPDWTIPGTKSIDWGPLSDIQLFDKFPFCLPWDVKNLVAGLVVTPVAPDFKFNISMAALHVPDFSFEVNFSDYQSIVIIIRWGLLLIVTGGLIFGAYKLINH